MSTVNVNRMVDSQGGVLAPISSVMRNRIINGDMRIDQRNAGASVTITNTGGFTYTLDRWASYGSAASKFSIQQNAGSVTPPIGFRNYLGCTSLSAYSISAGEVFQIEQFIEGFNVADLGWGTANAATVTLSFWVRSSLTGTFGGAICNDAFNRNYPFTYTISAANTWEQKSVTIAGDTSGTWLTNNGVGLRVIYSLGTGATFSGTAGAWAAGNIQSATGATSVVGTNGATFYITGVQLEKGTQATSFEYRQYGQELALCQRYFEKTYNANVAVGTNTSEGLAGYYQSSDFGGNAVYRSLFSTPKRAIPTITTYRETGTSGSWDYGRSGATGNATTTIYQVGERAVGLYLAVGASWVVCYTAGHWTASAEL